MLKLTFGKVDARVVSALFYCVHLMLVDAVVALSFFEPPAEEADRALEVLVRKLQLQHCS